MAGRGRGRGRRHVYTAKEYCDMVFQYGRANGSALRAQEYYKQAYPSRITPYHQTFSDVFNRLCEQGSFEQRMRDVGRSNLNLDDDEYLEERIEEIIRNDPYRSTRSIAQELGVTNHTRVWRILNSKAYYPYKLQLVAAQRQGDAAQRITFCNWFQNHQQDVARWIIYTDECIFKEDGPWNSRNEHYWSQNNPHMVRHRARNRFSLHVWAGLLNDKLLGPVVLPNPMTAELYLNFLQNDLPVLIQNAIEDIPLADRRDLWYQLDGSGPHFGSIVRDHLNNMFPNRWIGRGGPVAWPARSPDLTPLDFFLWGEIKRRVYSPPRPETAEELWAKIEDVANDIRNHKYSIEASTLSVSHRTLICIEKEGGRFEQFL